MFQKGAIRYKKYRFFSQMKRAAFLNRSRFLRSLKYVPFNLGKYHECHPYFYIGHIFVFTTLHSPGQASVLQSSVRCRNPGHSAPPCCGKGLLQNRCLILLPLSQPLSQTVHEDHLPQAPSRGTKAKIEQEYRNGSILKVCTNEIKLTLITKNYMMKIKFCN